MKIQGKFKIGDKVYRKGDEVAWWHIYPFFIGHMLIFGGFGFLMAYSEGGAELLHTYLVGGIAITFYLIFYFMIFGKEEVKWMFINAGLGSLVIYTQIDWILGVFGKQAEDYSLAVHGIPFLYIVLYTFILRQAFLDITGVRGDVARENIVGWVYVVVSVGFYLIV